MEFLELDGTNPRYENFHANATSVIDEATLDAATTAFSLPAPLQ